MAQTPPSLQLQAGVKTLNPYEVETDKGPYATVAEANAAISSAVRFIGKEAKIITAGVPVLHMYSGGILDSNLVPASGGGSAGGGSATSLIENITAGENLASGNLVYLKNDGKWWKSESLNVATCATELRVALAAITVNAVGSSLITGQFTTTGLTAGAIYYVGAAGSIVSVVPDTEGIVVRVVGTALSTTVFEFNPDSTYIETTQISPISNTENALTLATIVTANTTLASSNLLIPVDTTANSVNITLPSSPLSKDRMGAKHITQGSTNTVTITCASGQTFNKASGPTTLVLYVLNQACLLRFDSNIWYVESDSNALSQLDLRFGSKTAVDLNTNQIATLTASSQRRFGAFSNKNIMGVGSCSPYVSGILSNGTTDVAETSKISYYMIGKSTELTVYFTNYDSFQSSTISASDDMTLTASLEYPAGTLTKITFKNGDNSVLLRRGFGIASDFVKIFIPENTQYWIRTCVTVVSGQKWCRSMVSATGFYAYGQAFEGVLAGDNTMSGTIPQTNSYCYGPTAIFGVGSTTKGSVALYGDSISAGSGDNNPVPLRYEFGGGIYGRAFGFAYNTLSLNNPGCSLASIQKNLSVNYKYYDELLSSVQLFISNLGVNDFPVTSESVMQSHYINIWYNNYAHGIKGYQTTITPYTTSTDSWATIANQTASVNDSRRIFINTWMRDGAPINYSTKVAAATGATGTNIVRTGNILHPLRGIFDVAATVESSLNSGKWIVNGTANYATVDGLHGTPNSYPLMIVPIDLTLFNV